MKCSVCGNELTAQDTRCSVCGTRASNTSLQNAMSNISSLANALKAKREVTNNNKVFEKDIKKVATREEELEELYTKDINLVTPEDEYEEEFDLNAFYEESKRNKNKLEEESKDESNKVPDDEDDVKEEIVEESNITFDIEKPNKPETKIDEEVINDVDETNEAEESDAKPLDMADENKEEVEDIAIKDDSIEDLILPTTNETIDVESDEPVEEILPTVNEDQGENISSEETIGEGEDTDLDDASQKPLKEDSFDTSGDLFISFDEEDSVEDEKPAFVGGYIKASDIQIEDETSDETLNEKELVVEDDSQNNEVHNESQSQPQSVEIEKSEEYSDPFSTEEPRGKYDPVKAEDVPYTSLEEVKSNVSDSNPIVIDPKDIVGESNTSNDPSATQAGGGSNDSSSNNYKPNKFCAVMARIFLILAVLVFAVVVADKYLLYNLEQSNVVFDFIINFLDNKTYLNYVVLGTLGAGVLAILFSLMQLLFVKKRKIGLKVLLFSLFVTGLMAGGYYYFDILMDAINYIVALIA